MSSRPYGAPPVAPTAHEKQGVNPIGAVNKIKAIADALSAANGHPEQVAILTAQLKGAVDLLAAQVEDQPTATKL